MGLKAVLLFWLGWPKRACRLPPTMPTLGPSIPDESGGAAAVRAHATPGEPGLVVLLLLTSILVMPLFAPLTWVLPTSASMTLAEEIQDDTGVAIESVPAESSSEILILNSTPFDLQADWDWSSILDACTCTPTYRGLRLDMVPNRIPGIGTSSLYFSSRQHLVLEDYDATEWQIALELISGVLDITMSLDLSDWSSYGDLYRSCTWHINETGVVILSLEVPTALLRTVSTDWLLDYETSAWLSTDSAASAVVMNSTIEVVSDTALMPFTVDVANSSNASLFQDPFFKYMYEPPTVRLSKQGSPHNSTFRLLRTNTTIYLSPGNYEAEIGWASSYSYYDISAETIPFDVEVVVDEMRFVRAHLGATLLYLDIPLSAIVYEVRIGRSSWYDTAFYDLESWAFSKVDWQLPSRLYLPVLDDQITVYISYLVPVFLFGGLTRSGVMATLALADTHHNLRFATSPPVVSVLGVSIGLGEVIMLIPWSMTAFAFAKNVQWRIRQRGARAMIQDPRFLPTGLLILGVLLPWFATDNSDYRWYLSGTSYACVPIPVSWCANPHSSLMLIVNDLWYVLLLLSLPLYWRPLYLLAHNLSTSMEDEAKTTFKLLIAPVLLVVLVVTFPLVFGLATLSVGSLVIVAAPLVWGLQRAMKQREDGTIEKPQGVLK